MRANEARVRKLEADKAETFPVLVCMTEDGERGKRDAIAQWERNNGPLPPDTEPHWIEIEYI